MEYGEAKYMYVALKPLSPATVPSWKVRITSGKFNELEYNYTTWEIKTEDEKKKLYFDFDVCNPPVDKIDHSKQNKEMLSMMGNILLDIMVTEAKISDATGKNDK